MGLKNLFKLSKKKDQIPSNKVNNNQTPTPPPSSSSDLYPQPTIDSGTFNSVKDVNSQQGVGVGGDSTTTSFTSNNSNSIMMTGSNSNIYNQYNNLSNNENIPKELIPIITLINCQNSRIYHKSQLYLNIEKNDASLQQDLSYQLIDGIIKGNQIILFKENLQSSFKPISINLLEATIKIIDVENSLIISSSNKLAYHLKFNEKIQLQTWLSCIKLSNYEFIKLNESYTASLLSSKATLLSDLHVLMSETRFSNEEWCNIKFSKNSNWIKCFCVITPCDKFKRTKNHIKNGSIQFYTSSKTHKKNLICSINSIDSCFAVYPNHINLIDDSTLIKLNGDLTIYNLGLKKNSNDDDFDEISTSPNSPISRTTSIKSFSNYNNNNNNNNNNINSRSRSNSKSHLRSTSISSIGSSKSIKGFNIDKTSLYILPKTHNAVKNFETLIRFLIPLYDSFQLYGRPKKLIAEKFNLQSLLFGLPSLPHTEYLTKELVLNLIKQDWNNILIKYEIYDFNLLFSNKIKELSIKIKNFKGFGDLKNSLFSEINYEDPLSKFNNYSIPDFDYNNENIETPKYAFSISDLPPNVENFDKLKLPSNSNLNMLQQNNSPPPPSSSSCSNIPIIKTPNLKSSSNNLGSPMGVNSYTNLNSLVSSPSSSSVSALENNQDNSSNLDTPNLNSSNLNSNQQFESPTAITPHQNIFKKQRDSVPVVA